MEIYSTRKLAFEDVKNIVCVPTISSVLTPPLWLNVHGLPPFSRDLHQSASSRGLRRSCPWLAHPCSADAPAGRALAPADSFNSASASTSRMASSGSLNKQNSSSSTMPRKSPISDATQQEFLRDRGEFLGRSLPGPGRKVFAAFLFLASATAVSKSISPLLRMCLHALPSMMPRSSTSASLTHVLQGCCNLCAAPMLKVSRTHECEEVARDQVYGNVAAKS